jgi:hypothetical protein
MSVLMQDNKSVGHFPSLFADSSQRERREVKEIRGVVN